MDRKKKLLILIVGILTFTFIFTFYKIFSFENKDGSDKTSAYYPYIDEHLINKLYGYLPIDALDRPTVYETFYTKYSNLSQDVVLSMIYNYILNNDYFELLTLSKDEIAKEIADENIVPLYKIKLEAFDRGGKIVFGSNAEIPRRNFSINGRIKATYVEGFGYYIYEIENSTYEMDYISQNSYDKYLVTNNNDTIIIYDYFLKCDRENYTCYNDEKRKEPNSIIKNINGQVNLKDQTAYAQSYKHTFKFENGTYYWYSSESIDWYNFI